MGTDIHLFVEKRDSKDAPWRPALVETACTCRPSDEHRWCKGRKREAGYSDRNYEVFAMLANVRNGSGFAGCDTGDGFVPISLPRGLPDDLSPELRAVHDDEYDDGAYDRNVEQYGRGSFGDHSFSWVTLRELNGYDWARTTKRRGWVDPVEFKVFDENGRPNSWSGGVSGQMVVHVDNSVMRALVRGGYEPPKAWSPNVKSFYTQVEWTVTYQDAASRFYSSFLPALRDLGGDPENVRIVFGFDS